MTRLLVLGILLLVGVYSTASCTSDPDGTKACDAQVSAPITCGLGICQTSIPACVDGVAQTCPEVLSTLAEICGNGLDDDCDGLIDEACACKDADVQSCYSGSAFTREVGSCANGIQICTNGVWNDCTGEVLPELENCDDIFDNDCNGAVNDGCQCNEEGKQRECYGGPPETIGVSNCRAGLQRCVGGFWGDCKSDIIPGIELCDGVDTNCNGQIDEIPGCGCPEGDQLPCYTGDEKRIDVGICKKGYFLCKGGKWDSTTCLGEQLPVDEACNGLDDDCNGVVDDVPGLGLDCQTKFPSLCKFGKTACGIDDVTGFPGTICAPDVKPFQNPELACNLLDDNCDGSIDEGMACCPNDGIKNGSESDINCGGTCPERCPDGKICNLNGDCVSQVCVNGICAAISCLDNAKNGTETDIDCGGASCPKCTGGRLCMAGTDCTSGFCGADNRCTSP